MRIKKKAGKFKYEHALYLVQPVMQTTTLGISGLQITVEMLGRRVTDSSGLSYKQVQKIAQALPRDMM